MIDRFGGDRTYAFTPTAAEVILRAREIKNEKSSPILSLHHIELALIYHFSTAFGDANTQKKLTESLRDWRLTPPTAEETLSYLEAAESRARLASNKPVIRALDLLYTTLKPDSIAPPEGPLAFFRDGEEEPLAYRQRVYREAGGQDGRLYYNSPAHQVLELARRFPIIPPGLLASTNFEDNSPLQTTASKPSFEDPVQITSYQKRDRMVRVIRFA